ncbi:hypothetical protein Esti_001405 [Eimeria stiedai]
MAAEPGGKGSSLRVPTPLTSHLGDEQFKDVYEPSEDSFLLMDALQQDADTLKLLEPKTVLEMGQRLALKKQARGDSLPVFFAVDKQRGALDASRLTLKVNNPGVSLELLCCDLFGAFKRPLVGLSADPCAVREHGNRAVTCGQETPVGGGPFDLVIFNPPYVPGSPRAVVASEDLPWWGGVSGREVIDCFVDKVMEFLSPRGILYLLLERRNKPEEVVSILEASGCTGQLVASRKVRGEVLSIWRFSWAAYQGHSLLGDGSQASCPKPSS